MRRPATTNGPIRGALDAESLKSKHNRKQKNVGREIGVVLMDFLHMLHARSCNHFLSFPHMHRPPRPLNKPKHYNLFFCIFTIFTFWDYFLEPIWAMVTRPVQGP